MPLLNLPTGQVYRVAYEHGLLFKYSLKFILDATSEGLEGCIDLASDLPTGQSLCLTKSFHPHAGLEYAIHLGNTDWDLSYDAIRF